jgi:hypothetical protein
MLPFETQQDVLDARVSVCERAATARARRQRNKRLPALAVIQSPEATHRVRVEVQSGGDGGKTLASQMALNHLKPQRMGNRTCHGCAPRENREEQSSSRSTNLARGSHLPDSLPVNVPGSPRMDTTGSNPPALSRGPVFSVAVAHLLGAKAPPVGHLRFSRTAVLESVLKTTLTYVV